MEFMEHHSHTYHPAFWYAMGRNDDDIVIASRFASYYVGATWQDKRTGATPNMRIVNRYWEWLRTGQDHRSTVETAADLSRNDTTGKG